jgi:hypothetical protein
LKRIEKIHQVAQEQVFISYSHKDKKWREELEKHLKPFLRNSIITRWSDQQIAPGLEWSKEIQSALANSKVAVLLVSPDFLDSDFIHEHELGPLLKGAIKILWIPLRASGYKQTPLKDCQAVLDPNKPLANMTEAERDQAWVEICEEIENAVKVSKGPFPEDSSRASQPAQPIVVPPISQDPGLPGQHSPRRNILLANGGILAITIVTLAILFLMLRNMNQPMAAVANEVKIGDEIFLRDRDENYIVAAEISPNRQ